MCALETWKLRQQTLYGWRNKYRTIEYHSGNYVFVTLRGLFYLSGFQFEDPAFKK